MKNIISCETIELKINIPFSQRINVPCRIFEVEGSGVGEPYISSLCKNSEQLVFQKPILEPYKKKKMGEMFQIYF